MTVQTSHLPWHLAWRKRRAMPDTGSPASRQCASASDLGEMNGTAHVQVHVSKSRLSSLPRRRAITAAALARDRTSTRASQFSQGRYRSGSGCDRGYAWCAGCAEKERQECSCLSFDASVATGAPFQRAASQQ